MSISRDAKRVRFGGSLLDAKGQIQNSINVLKSVKINCTNMLAEMQEDKKSFEKDDCDEIQEILTILNNPINL